MGFGGGGGGGGELFFDMLFPMKSYAKKVFLQYMSKLFHFFCQNVQSDGSFPRGSTIRKCTLQHDILYTSYICTVRKRKFVKSLQKNIQYKQGFLRPFKNLEIADLRPNTDHSILY